MVSNYEKNYELIGHLLRRASFGANKKEIEIYAQKGYSKTVEELLYPSNTNSMPLDLIRRHHPEQSAGFESAGTACNWLYNMGTTSDPLTEKIILFWHNIFATGYSKVTIGKVLFDQLKMFKLYGMGNFKNLLIKLSQDPAMIHWLDNHDNHKGAINENYGRELLELFSMGVGNYSEDDIKECSRAFTGWTLQNLEYSKELAIRNSIWPYGKISWRYEYNEKDHDNDTKTFLGETGNFNGEDIIEIICKQPATANFLSRHLYNFFVADEPPVPQWPYIAPKDPKAIEILSKAYFESNYDIKHMLNVLFNSNFFKSDNCRYAKIKSPVDMVAGIIRLTKEFESPKTEILERNFQMIFMGQELLNPPSVEGWHQGTEWINTGSLTERLNFASKQITNISNPGTKSIIQNIIKENQDVNDPKQIINHCLEELGYINLSDNSLNVLNEFIGLDKNNNKITEKNIKNLLKLIVSAPEFQKV